MQRDVNEAQRHEYGRERGHYRTEEALGSLVGGEDVQDGGIAVDGLKPSRGLLGVPAIRRDPDGGVIDEHLGEVPGGPPVGDDVGRNQTSPRAVDGRTKNTSSSLSVSSSSGPQASIRAK